MIQRFLKFFRRRSRDFRVIPVEVHGLSAKAITSGTRKVIGILHQEGYQAFIVGGAVRDMLLGKLPKDFDVATDAEPQAIKRLFRRAYIIGRRFRIVHVHQGREIVEITTFRGAARGNEHIDEHGRILRDNAFGTHMEDAYRRDFTINALYYNPSDNTLWDAHEGYEDLYQQRLRTIGPPALRFREDPVRMLRMLRFSAKLGFQIDLPTSKLIKKSLPLLNMIPSARLADEFSKYLLGGYAQSGFQILLKWHLLPHFIHGISDTSKPSGQDREALPNMMHIVLAEADRRYAKQQKLSFGFMMAVILWSTVLIHFKAFRAKNVPIFTALQDAMRTTLDVQMQKVVLTKSLSAEIREVWGLQQMLLYPRVQKIRRLSHHRQLKAAIDFLAIRTQADKTMDVIKNQRDLPIKRDFLQENGAECAYWVDWWKYYLSVGAEKQDSMREKWLNTLEYQRKHKKNKPRIPHD